MRKIIFGVASLAVFIALLFAPFAAAADGSSDVQTVEAQEPTQFYSWDMISTYSGCLALTVLLTQFLKPLWPSRWKTQYLSYIVAFALLNIATLEIVAYVLKGRARHHMWLIGIEEIFLSSIGKRF